MLQLEDLRKDAQVGGILANQAVTVVYIRWYGSQALELTYKDQAGKLGNQLLYRTDEPRLEIVSAGRNWSFDADGALLRLASEAHRISLAHLFDPLLAVHSSLVDPLPHQITAVYEEMLVRQPLRFLLADDPGSGKTIMAGLLMKELLVRGDMQRCLVICPGSLVEQWQDELSSRFHLPFEIMTNDKIESARTGNWFNENPLAICRLDKLARDEDLLEKFAQTDWDLIICDEAHKMSASYFGGEVRYTRRYHLGQLAGSLTRNFLLMTATPHNGKEEDFQLFMALLDGDRFEGRFRDGVHAVDTSDLMRRLMKEQLLKFDGTPLFPERRAYTVPYTLTDAEAALYSEVTDYVREEFDRAESLENDGRRGNVGFALTILQRRLASSPEAIYQSLRRRREKLEARLREEQILKRGADVRLAWDHSLPGISLEDLDDMDDLPEDEIVDAEERVTDRATAARTIAELEAEIGTLRRLEERAFQVKASQTDRKWDELSALLQNNAEMFDAQGYRRKLVIFTEHRATLDYLIDRLRTLIGREEAVVTIHGGMGREERRKAQHAFTQDRDTQILVATDAAGEGINLQRAHLMVNYDLPWNPNRLEQRFGRIHRIGQTEVCHLWNLVASETREGAVFDTLFRKLEQERESLGGQVFDVLGQVMYENQPLRDLLVTAIRYGDQPDVRARLNQVVDDALDSDHIRQLLEERSLVRDVMDAGIVREVREQMERAEARRLQPFYVASFFKDAFQLLGGRIHEREPKRYEISRVPGVIRERDRQIGRSSPVLQRYERITFDKTLISQSGKPIAEFVSPGHPLLAATIDVILERYRDVLKRGAILVNPEDESEDIRALVYLEHAIQDGRADRNGDRRQISRHLQFVELDAGGAAHDAGYAPYLDYRPITDEERALVDDALEADWLSDDLEGKALAYAVESLVPEHLQEVRGRVEERVIQTMAAVQERLTKEITYWDRRAQDLKAQEQAGKTPRMNSTLAQRRADELSTRLERRMRELQEERQIAPLPPVVAGGALIVPQGLLTRLMDVPIEFSPDPVARRKIELLAMQAVMDAERSLGNEPQDVSARNLGWDIESRDATTDRTRFIEVKGRHAGATTVTVTYNEIRAGFNKPDDYILAVVIVNGDRSCELQYIRRLFEREPDFGVASVNYHLANLRHLAAEPG